MNILLNNSSMIPLYEQLMDQVKNGIIRGDFRENDALPSVRALSARLRISALTVKKAYDRLEEEGFVVTVHGKGTFVAATDRELAVEARRRAVEEEISLAVQRAKTAGLSRDEVREIMEIMLEDCYGND
ncbi:MAG: GntR family transcriptional regulator [Clostridia bacterium]|nr:GntR family transcriptional regulator [Clostridia bacterium]MBQ6000013.1 GntR family transcriptional regulator [Clostridia bacterium]